MARNLVWMIFGDQSVACLSNFVWGCRLRNFEDVVVRAKRVSHLIDWRDRPGSGRKGSGKIHENIDLIVWDKAPVHETCFTACVTADPNHKAWNLLAPTRRRTGAGASHAAP